MTADATQSLRWLQRHFVFTVVDKMANSLCFVCKKHYVTKMLDDLRDSDVFQEETLPMDVVQARLNNALQHFQLTATSQGFGSYYAIIKMHKSPPACCWSGKRYNYECLQTPRGCSTGFEPELLSILRDVHPAFQGIDGEGALTWHGLSNILKNTQDVVTAIERFNTVHHPIQATLLQTADISRSYIPLTDLQAKLAWLYNLVFARRPSLLLKIYVNPRHPCQWVPHNHEGGSRLGKDKTKVAWRVVSWEEVVLLMIFVFNNNYVAFGQKLYKQTQGIAMGGNASVFLAQSLFANI
jgi:hypothetical protein